MFGFLFKKKKKHALSHISNSLSKSFTHVKKDVLQLYQKDVEQDKKIDHLQKQLNRVEGKLMILSEIKVHVPREIKHDYEAVSKELESVKPGVWDRLTDLQKNIFVKLAILTQETGHDWISMKDLSVELYPDKKYSSIRSMISNYTDVLEEHGLIKKKRKGRSTYLRLTKKGLEKAPKKKIKVKARH